MAVVQLRFECSTMILRLLQLLEGVITVVGRGAESVIKRADLFAQQLQLDLITRLGAVVECVVL